MKSSPAHKLPHAPTLPKDQKADIIASLQRYLSTELDHELGNFAEPLTYWHTPAPDTQVRRKP